VIFTAMIWPLWLDHEVQLETIEPPHGGLAARGQAVEDLVAVDPAIVADGELGWVGEVDAGLFAAEAVQQHHQRDEQPRHQADEAVIVRQIAKAAAMLIADPVEVERLEILVRREVKQHHDEQHLGAWQLALALSSPLRRDQLVGFPVGEHLAEIVETAIESCDIDGHWGDPSEPGLTLSCRKPMLSTPWSFGNPLTLYP
jgi:hypothetical protein